MIRNYFAGKKQSDVFFCNLRYTTWICFFLIMATLLSYWQVKHCEFVYDDFLYITENSYVTSGFSLKNIKWSFTTMYGGIWHPLTYLSFMVDIQLFGMNPGALHFTNLLFHIINTLLLFLTLNRMSLKKWQSAFVAALFAFHPLHVESVVWITERKGVLNTFFLLLAIWCYASYVKKPDCKRYLSTLLFFFMGLMSKPMIVTLPFILLLLDYWPLQRMFKVEGRFKAQNTEH